VRATVRLYVAHSPHAKPLRNTKRALVVGVDDGDEPRRLEVDQAGR
jgi:hypothetical protein